MQENLPSLTPQVLYAIAKEQMKEQYSDKHQEYYRGSDPKRYGFDNKHRENLRRALCLTPDKQFDDDAKNVCDSKYKQGIQSLVDVHFIPERMGNIDHVTGEKLANRIMLVLEERGYELY